MREQDEKYSSMLIEGTQELECLDDRQDGSCQGPIELRMALSETGVSFPRCDHHWELRLKEQEGIDERYPEHQPSDFDPTYAGERWEED